MMYELNEVLIQWMQNAIGNKYWATILLSVIPMIEVKGAITVGTGLGINPWLAFLISCCSALVVCPFLLILLKPILKLLKRVKWFNRLAFIFEDFFRVKADKLIENSKENTDITLTLDERTKRANFNKCIGVFLFVAMPIPLTGVWTGSAVAAFLDLEYKYSIPAIIIGNFFAGLIITVLNIIFKNYASMILIILSIFMLVSIIYLVTTVIIKSRKIEKIPPQV